MQSMQQGVQGVGVQSVVWRSSERELGEQSGRGGQARGGRAVSCALELVLLGHGHERFDGLVRIVGLDGLFDLGLDGKPLVSLS